MLVLTRRADEAIVIGKDVVVRVLGVEKNGQVRIGIDAPRDVRILREELRQEISEVNRSSLASGDLMDQLGDLLGGSGSETPS